MSVSTPSFEYRGAMVAFAILLAIFLAVTVAVIVAHERDMLEGARMDVRREMALVSALLRESLLKHDYATAEEFLNQWGEEREDIVRVRATAPNGFVLADYRRAKPSEYRFRVKETVVHNGRDLITLETVNDFTAVKKSLFNLGATLVGGAVFLTALLGFALWYSLKRLAIAPLEQEIARRQEAEAELTLARDKLEERVKERTEELTREMETAQRYLDVAGVMFVVIGADQRVQLINKRGCDILGYPEDEVTGKNWFENFLPVRLRNEVKDVFDMLMRGELDPVEYFENPVLTKDGKERIIAWRNAIIYDGAGKPAATLSSGEDITKRKEAEEKMAYSESRLRSIIEAEPECVKVVSQDGILRQINQAGAEMVEAPDAEELVGKPVFPIIAPEHRNAFSSFLTNVCSGNSGSLEFDVVGLKGTRKSLESHAVPFLDDRTKTTMMLTVTRDVTERRRLEERLQQARKMESIGTLTGGIAHDFNNILSAIIGFGESLEMQMSKEDPLRPYLEQMLTAAEKGTKLTRSLLAFGRKLVIKPAPVKLNSIVEEVQKIVMGLIGEGIMFESYPADPALTVMADTAQMEQAMINLCTNARDAMPHGGTLRISATEVLIDADFIRRNGFGKPGRFGRISVSDTGVGMDEAIKQRIFDPFFTTKSHGMGTGLGLSTVYGIVKQHNGFIDVQSQPGKGSVFNVYLPVVRLEARREAEEPSMPPLVGGNETVLVAEDDTAVRKILADVLAKFGYRVLEAADGAEAVEVFKSHKDEVDLLLLDIIMPKMSGREAYDEIAKSSPDVRVLFTSGQVSEIINREIVGHLQNFLPKPVSPKQIIRKVREVLDGKAEAS